MFWILNSHHGGTSPQVTVHFVPAPTFVLICQLGVSAAVVKICDMLGYLEADKFEWDKVGGAAWRCMEVHGG